MHRLCYLKGRAPSWPHRGSGLHGYFREYHGRDRSASLHNWTRRSAFLLHGSVAGIDGDLEACWIWSVSQSSTYSKLQATPNYLHSRGSKSAAHRDADFAGIRRSCSVCGKGIGWEYTWSRSRYGSDCSVCGSAWFCGGCSSCCRLS